jgi:hypothetical protein
MDNAPDQTQGLIVDDESMVFDSEWEVDAAGFFFKIGPLIEDDEDEEEE